MPARAMKATIAHCVATEKPSIERACVEKPPVGSVVNACATASNRFMRSSSPVQPITARTSTMSTVSAR